MVLSKLNENVSYVEQKTINENDKGRDVSMFKISLYEIPVIIALGDIKYDFVKENLLFCPVYLIINTSNKIYQIGVYEFMRDNFDKIQDEDGDINIAVLDGPLLYSFVSESYLQKCVSNEVLLQDDSGDDEEEGDLEDEKDDEKDDRESDNEDDEDSGESSKKNSPILVELGIEGYQDDDDFLQKGESEKDDKKIKKKYKKKTKTQSSWIQSYLSNNNYTVTDNDGKGDCLFYTVRDAFKTVSIDANVKELRGRLASKADQSRLDDYKEHFNMYDEELKNLIQQKKKNKRKRKIMITKFNTTKKKAKAEKDIPARKKMLIEAKAIKKDHDKVKGEYLNIEKEMKNAHEMISEFNWVKNINTVEELKAKIKTCDFWADSWAINTLELLINTKIIILSSDYYNKGLYKKILSCGEFVSQSVEEKGYFKPKYYIIVEHTGNHYKLIGYNDLKIFRFHQIPWSIKNEIITKCLKTDGKNIYHYIPKFAKLVGKTIIPSSMTASVVGENKHSEKKVSDEAEEGKEITSSTKIKLKTQKQVEDEEYTDIEMSQTPTPTDDSMYDPETVFMFHSGSAQKPPGKGTGEKIIKDKMIEFNELAKTKNWRRVLSNFYTKSTDKERPEPLFELDGLKWASVEHWYHANKFKKNNNDYYRLFSIDSASQIMSDPKKALGAGGKTGKIKGKKFRPKDIVMDEDFFEDKNNEKVMERGQSAKYDQDELSKKVLLNTKDAKLIHYIKSRKPKDQRPEPQPFYDTMRIRHRLQKKN